MWVWHGVSMKLRNKRVLVTGGGSGIGLALAVALLRVGNRVFISGRNAEKLNAAVRRHPGLKAIHCDIASVADAERAAAWMDNEQGGLDVLVNNAAIGSPYTFVRNPEAAKKAECEILTNLVGTIRLTHLFLPQLLRQPAAAIITITSGLAVAPAPGAPGYSASKAGLHSFLVSLRAQLRRTGVKVFEVQPPMVATDLVKDARVRKMTPDAVAERILSGVKRDRHEIKIAEVRLMHLVSRALPGLLNQFMIRYPISLEAVEEREESSISGAC